MLILANILPTITASRADASSASGSKKPLKNAAVLNIDFLKSTKEKIYVNFFFNKIEYYTLYSKTASCIFGDFVIEGFV
jgi:hypothetical protein